MTEPSQPIKEQQNKVHAVRPRRGRLSLLWRKAVAFTKLRILHVTDSPHTIALGLAAGVFVGFAAAPAIGSHMVLALALAFVLRGNKLAAVAGAWVSNPLTLAPIVVGGYELGKSVIRLFGGRPQGDVSQLIEFLRSWEERGMTGMLGTPEMWREFAGYLWRFGMELWLGCCVMAVVAAVLTYFAAKEIVIEHRKRNPHRRHGTGV